MIQSRELFYIVADDAAVSKPCVKYIVGAHDLTSNEYIEMLR